MAGVKKSCGMCCPVSVMVHIKDPLLHIGKSSYLNGPLPYVCVVHASVIHSFYYIHFDDMTL